jgi:hypothetical protein
MASMNHRGDLVLSGLRTKTLRFGQALDPPKVAQFDVGIEQRLGVATIHATV